MNPTIKNVKIVDEEVIIEAAKMFGAGNSFESILEVADAYRDADMTPMFLWDIDDARVYCVAKETFRKKLH